MWSEHSSQLDTKPQLLNVSFHVGKGPQQMHVILVSHKSSSDIKPQRIYPAQWKEHTAHPEDFMGWSDQLNHQVTNI